MKTQIGLENLLSQPDRVQTFKRVGLLVNQASVNYNLQPSLQCLVNKGFKVSSLFSPQHGFFGEKQDNMIESKHSFHPQLKVPIYSLYSETRRLTPEMWDSFDTLVFDIQDVGCRVYTFLTTLCYILQDAQKRDKKIIILDRPNPAGRSVEGFLLSPEYKSFVGEASLPIRHGLTLGEVALWFQKNAGLDIDLEVILLKGYNIDTESWPRDRAWVNPSPNLPRYSSTQIYSGTVLFEGACLSEGRGTTRPLEMVGAPFINGQYILQEFNKEFASWGEHCLLREVHFEPSFHKFSDKVCQGVQIHVDVPIYSQKDFKPFRLVAGLLKTIRLMHPEDFCWSQPPYEYEEKLLPIDILSGSSFLRKWVDSCDIKKESLHEALERDENTWSNDRKSFFLYK